MLEVRQVGRTSLQGPKELSLARAAHLHRAVRLHRLDPDGVEAEHRVHHLQQVRPRRHAVEGEVAVRGRQRGQRAAVEDHTRRGEAQPRCARGLLAERGRLAPGLAPPGTCGGCSRGP